MIVVTGSPRSGTSLMMQTLFELGVTVAAPKFTEWHFPIKEHNENGFYEFGEEIRNGINHDRFKGSAVKMFGESLFNTEKIFIQKIIRITRNSYDVIKSLNKIMWHFKTHFSAEQIYLYNELLITEYLLSINHFTIKLEEVVSNPIKSINDLISYLEITPNEIQITNAKNNIICH